MTIDKEFYDAVYSISGQRKKRGFLTNEAILPDDADVLEMANKLSEFLDAFPGQTRLREVRAQLDELLETLGAKNDGRNPDTPPDLVRR